MKIDILKNKMAEFMICEGIGNNRNEFDFTCDENGLYDITITVNGKEIDVERFLDNLTKNYNAAVKKQAVELLKSEYERILNLDYHDLYNGALTSGELLNLTFGDKIKIIWYDTFHKENEEHYGVIHCDKIIWEDGLEDNIKIIAECIYNNQCKVYKINY